jgi:hypothetical protein
MGRLTKKKLKTKPVRSKGSNISVPRVKIFDQSQEWSKVIGHNESWINFISSSELFSKINNPDQNNKNDKIDEKESVVKGRVKEKERPKRLKIVKKSRNSWGNNQSNFLEMKKGYQISRLLNRSKQKLQRKLNSMG